MLSSARTRKKLDKHEFMSPLQAISKLSSMKNRELASFSWSNNVHISAPRSNFRSRVPVIEYNCRISLIPKYSMYLRHACDGGPGSSGSALISKIDGEYVLLGVHVSGTAKDLSATEYYKQNSTSGNYFVRAHHILEALEELEAAME